MITAEEKRLEEDRQQSRHWRRWGPYLSERQWGTVREDYSCHGNAWEHFSHDQARSRAYRWGEDGIAGISDNHQRLCFAVTLWNGEDPILKERLFGLAGGEGNHGEDVKEYYFYLDNTPTHSYMKYLYKYPHGAFPYRELVEGSRRRGSKDLEYELIDTGVFDENRYFDIFVEYAKASPDDLLIRIEVANHGPEKKRLYVLPTLWFRNTWSWGRKSAKPTLRLARSKSGISYLEAEGRGLGKRLLFYEGAPRVLFTENETNFERLYGLPNREPYVKDAFHKYLIQGKKETVNPGEVGTKAALLYELQIGPGERTTVQLRLTECLPTSEGEGPKRGVPGPWSDFESVLAQRKEEADEFYEKITPKELNEDHRNVQRQAFAGMLWNKQFYHYVMEDWLKGDPGGPPPPESRKGGRNSDWVHLYNDDVLSMPDKWEYPWFASWDLAFHCIPLAMLDPEFAKRQLILLTREWYMHPNGQIPAYEWAFGDVNPPVHAWAAWRVYKIEKKMCGRQDLLFLERVFQKLLLNFTWWVNRKDAQGRNIFQGGFLGLDNISVFDRSVALPTGGYLDQSDGTSWMAMYCLNMLTIALELAKHNPSYEDIASKFFEHFLYIAEAMTRIGKQEISLWDEEDGFFYDVLHLPDGRQFPLKVRSMVGLIPLFAVSTLEPDLIEVLPGFKKRLEWFTENRPDLCKNVASMKKTGVGERRLLSIVSPERLSRVLEKMLDEDEFLSPFGIRSVSRVHKEKPYVLYSNGTEHRVDYEPAESSARLFGGNSNWRGPIWFPVNFLILESLQKFHYYLGDSFKVECPLRSGKKMTLWEVSTEISHRLIKIFLGSDQGERAVNGGHPKFQSDRYWRDYLLFYEYFHGDNGAGVGAAHQTGWTGLVAKLIQQCGEYCGGHKPPQLIKKGVQEKVVQRV